MDIFKVPFSYEMYGYIEVKAKDEKEARTLAQEELNNMGIEEMHARSSYLMDSARLDEDEVIVEKSFLGLHLGDNLLWHVDEFDTVKPIDTPCVVTEILDDHAIATTSDKLHLWIDKDNLDDFRKGVVA